MFVLFCTLCVGSLFFPVPLRARTRQEQETTVEHRPHEPGCVGGVSEVKEKAMCARRLARSCSHIRALIVRGRSNALLAHLDDAILHLCRT